MNADAPPQALAAAGDVRALAQAVAALMADFSLELTPGEMAKMRALPAELPAGSRIYVTWIQGSDFARTVATCARLRDAGMVPVPHLAARAIESSAALDAILGELWRSAGVEHAMLVAGSVARPAGAFDSVAALLATGLFEQHGMRRLCVAGHPEGSPDVSASALDEALRRKLAHAQRTGTPMHLVTQFCFAAEPIVRWERELRRVGIDLSIHAGLPGLASLSTLLKYARHCGVGASMAALAKRGASMLKLVGAVAPSETVIGLACARLADPASRIERCHFFPFGSFDATAAWAAALAAGAFTIGANGRDLMLR